MIGFLVAQNNGKALCKYGGFICIACEWAYHHNPITFKISWACIQWMKVNVEVMVWLVQFYFICYHLIITVLTLICRRFVFSTKKQDVGRTTKDTRPLYIFENKHFGDKIKWSAGIKFHNVNMTEGARASSGPAKY